MQHAIGIIIWIVLILIILFLFVSMINIVPQQHAYVIERLGKYSATWGAGFHLKIPVIERVSRKVLLKEQVADFAPQPVITKDNVTMMIDSVVYFKVMNSHDYTYGVENPIMAMENLTATTLRNIIGDLELDATLTSRETINEQMLQIIDAATDPWGIKVTRVELKNIQPPAAIRESMEKQMKAEREKRAVILTAEGEKQSMILKAEGDKEAKVLEAEANKQSVILAAEGQKEKEIREAEGQAEAIIKVQQATADGIKAVKDAAADDAVIKLKSLEAFAAAANGQATKIIIPSEIQGLAGLAEGIAESVKK
ncbi:MAG: SPFH/Band 7/PHB domain protein [Solobacterium sp.]|jgi:regulator of protease activity HflC (stomatin/prohibitin superfamily)|nr:SPFH/Band 7/PHB domain protein [Solobacterium sp.]MCH4204786.1 SPFH/Band 7/PHB domain protein [Solobacterium sp.]MCH4226410.1 SPFH/Band 7/PHB domain protein [Solobacterium sp.]MCH4282400.1 SPFH/Band 7/PHB domain protein [Solobacterium sp.]